jgi:uncharacterized protein
VRRPRPTGHPGVRPTFQWDEHNEDKLLETHDVSAHEAEQCFANPNTRRRQGEDLLMLGVTDDGRMLLAVYAQKPQGLVRVYSARDMTTAERRVYREKTR